jgi:hypothetical protein
MLGVVAGFTERLQPEGKRARQSEIGLDRLFPTGYCPAESFEPFLLGDVDEYQQ